MFIGINDKAKKITAGFVGGVNNTAHQIVKGYYGDKDGIAREIDTFDTCSDSFKDKTWQDIVDICNEGKADIFKPGDYITVPLNDAWGKDGLHYQKEIVFEVADIIPSNYKVIYGDGNKQDVRLRLISRYILCTNYIVDNNPDYKKKFYRSNLATMLNEDLINYLPNDLVNALPYIYETNGGYGTNGLKIGEISIYDGFPTWGYYPKVDVIVVFCDSYNYQDKIYIMTKNGYEVGSKNTPGFLCPVLCL